VDGWVAICIGSCVSGKACWKHIGNVLSVAESWSESRWYCLRYNLYS